MSIALTSTSRVSVIYNQEGSDLRSNSTHFIRLRVEHETIAKGLKKENTPRNPLLNGGWINETYSEK